MSLYSHSDFDYEVIGTVVVIYDMDHGGRQVTNDIQQVLSLIAEETDLSDKLVIYRDSQKVFDGINHKRGIFRSFYAINETVLEMALNKVSRLHVVH